MSAPARLDPHQSCLQFLPVTCANPFCLEHHGGPSASKPNLALLFLFSEFSALPPLNNQHHANNTSTGRGPYRRIMFFSGIWYGQVASFLNSRRLLQSNARPQGCYVSISLKYGCNHGGTLEVASHAGTDKMSKHNDVKTNLGICWNSCATLCNSSWQKLK